MLEGISGLEDSSAWIGKDASLGVRGVEYEASDDMLPDDDWSLRSEGGRDQ